MEKLRAEILYETLVSSSYYVTYSLFNTCIYVNRANEGITCCHCGLTVTWKLCHGCHERTVVAHMTLELLCELLLGSGMKLLLERDWLKGGEPASHIVDDRYGLTC